MKRIILLSIVCLSTITLSSCYDFNREQKQKDAESDGKAVLLEAESSKKAMIEEAKAKSESAVLAAKARLEVADLDAKSKVKKAEADAIAIEKVGAAINKNPEYLKYLQIEAIKGNKGEKFFIPTEANVPLLLK